MPGRRIVSGARENSLDFLLINSLYLLPLLGMSLQYFYVLTVFIANEQPIEDATEAGEAAAL